MSHSPTFSIVIPAFNQAEYLSQALQSVLDQTFTNFEVIVVNDASSDNTQEVVNKFDDVRIRYLIHPENRGLPAARNTGMRASTGEFIVLLDADDYFHSKKLEVHFDFLNKHPEIGVSYNSRFDLHHSSNHIRDLYRPPFQVGLRDFVLGFPFTPSDLVIRREWAFQVDLFDESYVCGGEDLDFPCRLALAGCQFASVSQVLNFRRFHSGRRRKNLSCRLDDYTRALEGTFADQRCPDAILALQNFSLSNHYLEVADYALIQGENDLGQEIIQKVIRLDISWLSGSPSRLLDHFLRFIIRDDSQDHKELLKTVIQNLPLEAQVISEDYDWAVAHGYLSKGVRAIMWGRCEAGQEYFSLAKKYGALIDESFIQKMTAQLLSYELEFGRESTHKILHQLAPYLQSIGPSSSFRELKSSLSVNRAYQNFREENYLDVPRNILVAMLNNPTHIRNRGVLSIFLRSLIYSPYQLLNT